MAMSHATQTPDGQGKKDGWITENYGIHAT